MKWLYMKSGSGTYSVGIGSIIITCGVNLRHTLTAYDKGELAEAMWNILDRTCSNAKRQHKDPRPKPLSVKSPGEVNSQHSPRLSQSVSARALSLQWTPRGSLTKNAFPPSCTVSTCRQQGVGQRVKEVGVTREIKVKTICCSNLNLRSGFLFDLSTFTPYKIILI